MKARPSQEEANRRERALDARESALDDREAAGRLRDEALLVREADDAERTRQSAETRDVNEQLVLAMLRADELAEQAEAARAEVAASEERFRSLVTASAALVFRADGDGRLRDEEGLWARYTGQTPEAPEGAAPGEGWLHAVHPNDRAATSAAWARAVAAGAAFTHEHRLARRDGGYAWVSVRAVPIPRGGPVREWVGMVTDVSDRVRLEEAREQFIAILGHDLRSPLNVIQMTAQLLTHGASPEPPATASERITRSIRRMDGMIGDLLDFARGRLGGGIPVVRALTDLRRLGAEAVADARHAHPSRRIDYEAAGELEGAWDAARLEQVVTNLIGNAIRHGEDPITVSLAAEEGAVVLTVSNRGTPIPEGLLPSLFEPFRHRAEGRSEGLGLGLYIVSEIVRAHGGTIAVTSSESEGTTFVSRWPRG